MIRSRNIGTLHAKGCIVSRKLHHCAVAGHHPAAGFWRVPVVQYGHHRAQVIRDFKELPAAGKGS